MDNKIKIGMLIVFILVLIWFMLRRNKKSNTQYVENKIEKFDKEHSVNSVNKIILYHADWCGHCKRFLPVWKNFIENNPYKNIIFDTIESSSLNEKESSLIKAFPTVVFINGDTQSQSVGVMTQDELKEKIESFFNIVQ